MQVHKMRGSKLKLEAQIETLYKPKGISYLITVTPNTKRTNT